MIGSETSLVSEFGQSLLGRRITLTGASGFVGTHFAKALVELGAQVKAIDLVKPTAAVACEIGNLADYQFVERCIADQNPEIIFHLASKVTAAQDDSLVLDCLHANVVASVNVLMSAHKTGCETVVMMGTMEEPPPGAVPTSPYSASKAAVALYGRLFAHVYGRQIIHVKPSVIYGPGQVSSKLIPHVINSLLDKRGIALNSPERLCDFIYINDVVRALLKIAVVRPNLAAALELGGGKPVTIEHLVDKIHDVMHLERPSVTAPPDAVRKLERSAVSDLSAIKAALDWEPIWDLDSGLKQTVEWYRDNRNANAARQNQFAPQPNQATGAGVPLAGI